MTLDFAGRVVIVTGAGTGLGASFTRALAGAGATVVLAGRREERLATVASGLPGDHLAVGCDVSDSADRQHLVDRAVGAFGRIDGLVNNAGAVNHTTALRESDEDFRRVLEVNLVAPFALACAVARAMRAGHHQGAIVNITSTLAIRSIDWSPWASYVAAKTGLAGLTRELASQWGRYGIRVNAIAPGPFETEMSGDAFVSGPVAESLRSRLPLGRPGALGDLDAALLLLLHPAGEYITGQTLAVDGGLSTTG